MKKLWISIGTLVALFVGFILFIQNVNLNRLGAESYFVKITTDGKKIEDVTDTGEKWTSYEYELEGVNEKDEVKTLNFTSHKQLRHDAYLEVFVKDENEVTSYQEVQQAELPDKVKKKLN
ncbi:YxeA family protein [Bacillus sp. FJAT-52991]|uniref:YxeA family protein n=1 Tax=Bacillus kandeliae TaxID=3129297 RepID=A0ABZ2N549_9BACI